MKLKVAGGFENSKQPAVKLKVAGGTPAAAGILLTALPMTPFIAILDAINSRMTLLIAIPDAISSRMTPLIAITDAIYSRMTLLIAIPGRYQFSYNAINCNP